MVVVVVVVEENKFPKSDNSHFKCLNHQSHDCREDVLQRVACRQSIDSEILLL